MYSSDRLLAKAAKLKKAHFTEPMDNQVLLIRAAFSDLNRHLPPVMVEDLFEAFASSLAEGPGDTAFDRCQKLADLQDLLHQEYDTNADPLAVDDWSVIGEIVSDYALDLDMGFVSYAMKLVVEHNGI